MRLLAKAFLWLHVSLYRLTNGRIGGRFVAGSPILLLTTTGRRSGKRRTRPLAYVRDDDRYVLCASNGGSPAHPGWYHNLAASGRAEIQVGAEHLTVGGQDGRPGRAAPAVPPLCPDVQGYGAYEDTTSRQIPLVLLTPPRPVLPPQPGGPITVQRRVSPQGALMVAWHKIHAGMIHAGKTATVICENAHFRVVIDGATAAVVPRTTIREIHRYKANATDKGLR
jgi:deazaflavin-dependent oxidoreductase (nitroreductase family)